MTRTETNSDTTILRLTLATLVAFLLAGAGILVSANSQIPVFANYYRLQQPQTNSSTQAQRPQMIATRHHPEQAFTRVALLSTPKIESKIKPIDRPVDRPVVKAVVKPNKQDETALSAEQLKYNALAILRSMPDYFPSDTEYKDAVAQLNKRIKSQQLEINVRTFLLSQHVSNESRLAELQMQPFFAEFDRTAFSDKQSSQSEQSVYTGVGFPHIESNDRSSANRYKPYKQLMSFSEDANGDVVPYVRCMGLSPERVAKRASQYDEQIADLSARYNVSASLIKAVIAKESCFNPAARSHVGAIGLMQLMPATARWLKVKQPENPQQNLAGGVRYLAQLRKRFGGDELALAAYNAGPANVERYHGIPPFDETENYVVDVMHFYRGYAATTNYVNSQQSYYYP